MRHPVIHANGKPDNRYRIALEWCGYSERRYVARFCDDVWLGQGKTWEQAWVYADRHNQQRMESMS